MLKAKQGDKDKKKSKEMIKNNMRDVGVCRGCEQSRKVKGTRVVYPK